MTHAGRPGAPPAGAGAAARSGAREVTGAGDGAGLSIGIACARFHGAITERLLEGALGALAARGVRARDVTVARVPGAFELPVAARHLIRAGADAVVCLGVVIRGETPHFDYVAGEAARGIARAAEETGVPVLLGVLTVEDEAQAWARAGGPHGDKGAEAAEGAVEMANLVRALRSAAR
ncbi:MAG: 6,7-dimethyl-8-ribityllumazine synthase [Hyphomicrobiales bacterium]